MKTILPSISLAVLLGLAVAPYAQAWGPEGHEIVAEIALHYLTPTARIAVDDVLGTFGFDRLCNDLMDALLVGWQPAEVVWTLKDV